jgi:hypothetical protein
MSFNNYVPHGFAVSVPSTKVTSLSSKFPLNSFGKSIKTLMIKSLIKLTERASMALCLNRVLSFKVQIECQNLTQSQNLQERLASAQDAKAGKHLRLNNSVPGRVQAQVRNGVLINF